MNPSPIDRLVTELSKLPGVGEKTAARLAFFILRQSPTYAQQLAQAVMDIKEKVRLCSSCLNLTEQDPCAICSDPRRDETKLCVVEEPSDVLALEKTGIFRGRYHVLHGVISPLDGIGPEEIKVAELIKGLQKRTVTEIIIATNPNVEGEATSLYLTKVLKPLGVKLSRLASGVPLGSELEYIDLNTLSHAVENRRAL